MARRQLVDGDIRWERRMHVLTARTRYDFGTESGSLFFCLKSGYMLYLEAARGPGLVANVSPIRIRRV